MQVADIVGGSIAYSYDFHKIKNSENNDYRAVLGNKLLGIKEFPEVYDPYKTITSIDDRLFNPIVAQTSYRHALKFREGNLKSEDNDIRQQIAIVDYLLFRMVNHSDRTYISTKELKNHLLSLGFEKISTQTFRTKIIAKLRDKGVLISSSSKGYKIPTNEGELYDFINHGQNMIMPMVARLKKCCEIIYLGSNGTINLLETPEFEALKKFCDAI